MKYSIILTKDDERYVRGCLRSHLNNIVVPEDILVDTIRGLETNAKFSDWLEKVLGIRQ